ncbi:hypothetical protein ANN_10042 [Periplaneta americana]|uniref:Histone-lysine N-methyltransferase SETMAR n=1 Tax=Periplaneta americana TaxID=6978 RepID=A0ABQ8TN25_PERAM|nr:hypothetical protein ANN_10042 [Periplaneta americana]
MLHDNALPHTARHTMDITRDLRWEVLEHPPYSPDLSLCGFQIFGKLKCDLGGRRFATDGRSAAVDCFRSLITNLNDSCESGITPTAELRREVTDQ